MPAVDEYDTSIVMINAANPYLLRWLSNIAQAFDNYRFRKMKIKWIPTSSITVTGSMILSYEPNPA